MSLTESGIQKLIDTFQNENTWLTIGGGFLKIIAIVIISNILIRIGKIAIRNAFKIRNYSPLRSNVRREETLEKLLDNILSYVIYFIAFMMVLSVFDIDVKALLAGAGIVGLAVGFGAQNLVRDIITGFFIIFEDQFSVGDHIRVGEFEGDVQEIGLRTTKIKHWTGEVHILPNGSITQVTNFSLFNSIAVIDVGIAYEEDIEKAEKAIEELLDQLPERYEELVKRPDLLGVQMMGQAEVTFRIIAETLPMKHYAAARKLRKDIKIYLDKQGIEIAYPRLITYSKDQQQSKGMGV